jgi:hypothetical protein
MSEKIVKVNPESFGIKAEEAKEVEKAFSPMIEKMSELEEKYNEIVEMAKERVTPPLCRSAKNLRKEYVKTRTGTSKIHKKAKDYHLLACRFIDGWKNAQKFASQGKEEKLLEIEEHFERIEAARIAELEENRKKELEPYVETIPEKLGEMDEEVWKNFLKGSKINWKARKDAEEKAERERIEAEKKKLAEEARIREENAKLRKEAEEREAKLRKEAKEREEREAKLKKEAEEREAKLRKEAKEREARLRKEAKEREEKIRKEAEEKLRKKIEREEKIRKEEERKKEKLDLGEGMSAEKAAGVLGDFLLDFEGVFTSEEYVIKWKVVQANIESAIKVLKK